MKFTPTAKLLSTLLFYYATRVCVLFSFLDYFIKFARFQKDHVCECCWLDEKLKSLFEIKLLKNCHVEKIVWLAIRRWGLFVMRNNFYPTREMGVCSLIFVDKITSCTFASHVPTRSGRIYIITIILLNGKRHFRFSTLADDIASIIEKKHLLTIYTDIIWTSSMHQENRSRCKLQSIYFLCTFVEAFHLNILFTVSGAFTPLWRVRILILFKRGKSLICRILIHFPKGNRKERIKNF